jgi:hypothetical protein
MGAYYPPYARSALALAYSALEMAYVWYRTISNANVFRTGMGMSEKRTKADRLERQTEQLDKRADHHPDEIEKKPLTLSPSQAPTQ